MITSFPDNPLRFAVGDGKWQAIAEAEDGTFTFDDLVREENTGAQSTVEGAITVADDGESLEIEFPETGRPRPGRWFPEPVLHMREPPDVSFRGFSS